LLAADMTEELPLINNALDAYWALDCLVNEPLTSPKRMQAVFAVIANGLAEAGYIKAGLWLADKTIGEALINRRISEDRRQVHARVRTPERRVTVRRQSPLSDQR
jgi:hypothetical protein